MRVLFDTNIILDILEKRIPIMMHPNLCLKVVFLVISLVILHYILYQTFSIF